MAEDTYEQPDTNMKPKKGVKYWHGEISSAEKHSKKWEERGKAVVKRFKGEGKRGDQFNILWSNTNTLRAALFAQIPKPEVSRRWKDKDDAGRVAATILERCLEFEVEHSKDYTDSIKYAVLDRLLPGRGIAWVRFEADVVEPDESQITEDVEVYDEQEDLYGVFNERTPCDYVYWCDFLHQPARTWEEVEWVARKVYMGKSEAVERFGDVARQLEYKESSLADSNDQGVGEDQGRKNKVCIYEIWCKTSKKAYWFAKGLDQLLDEEEDPLELDQFFPCPKPLFATLTTDSLTPIPDFTLYQDQANEVDELTARISLLTKALKVTGVYDAANKDLSRVLDGSENKMIPVDSWAMFAEKGGIKGTVDFFPIEKIANVLQTLIQLRDNAKAVIYEITGISDIVRGASVASETATAQQIKSNFASMRLNDIKADVANFVQELLRIKAEIMCSNYQDETLVKMSGIETVEQDPMLIMQALQLLRDEPARNFRIEIDVDSLINMDRENEKAQRMEFLQAVGAFVEKAVPMAQQAPQMTKLLGEMLMFGVRGFKVGRNVEAAFDDMVEQMANAEQDQLMQAQQQMQQMQEQIMGYEQQMQDMQSQMENAQASADAQMKAQLEQAKAAAQQQIDAARNELERMKIENQAQNDQSEIELARYKADLDAATKVLTSQISKAEAPVDVGTDSMEEAMMLIQETLAALSKPREVIVQRDEMGNIIGAGVQ